MLKSILLFVAAAATLCSASPVADGERQARDAMPATNGKQRHTPHPSDASGSQKANLKLFENKTDVPAALHLEKRCAADYKACSTHNDCCSGVCIDDACQHVIP